MSDMTFSVLESQTFNVLESQTFRLLYRSSYISSRLNIILVLAINQLTMYWKGIYVHHRCLQAWAYQGNARVVDASFLQK